MITYDVSSRYYQCDDTDNIPQHNMIKDNYIYSTTKVLANEAGRLDLVSYRVYNTPTKWWIIARFNAIINPTSVSAGMTLRIPYL